MLRKIGIPGRVEYVLRDHAVALDVAVAALLSVVMVVELPHHVTLGTATIGATFGLAATSSVAWRRRAPCLALLVAGAGMVGYACSIRTLSLAEALALLLATYTVGARGVSRRQVAELAALVAYGVLVCVLVYAAVGSFSASSIAVVVLPISIAPAVVGCLVGRQRTLAERLAIATEQLRDEEQARLAGVRTHERNRIARDLHDVVTHGVSVMVVQAGAARLTVNEEPTLSRAALDEVIAAGRAALVELRRILGTIGFAEKESFGPAYGVRAIADLVERTRAGGLPVTITVSGAERGLPPTIDVAVYRLIQEALTNVLRHAGPVTTEVDLRVEPSAVEVDVRNAAPVGSSGTLGTGAPGHGLIGMRQRVESAGGRVWSGPRPDGGFEVRAELPMSTDPKTALAPTERLFCRIRGLSPWPETIVALVLLCASAWVSADRRGSLALNVGLVVGMSVALFWRRRSPLWFLVAVNLLAVPISNGLASPNNPTLVSTFVFVVPVWAVAAWCETEAALAGLALAVAFLVGEGLYWHLGAFSIVTNVLLTSVLWMGGRVVRSQRLMSADLRRTLSLVEAEQEARERLVVVTERARLVAVLHIQVADDVTAMTVTAESVGDLVSVDPTAAVASLHEIERAGRKALAHLREILGLLRAEHDPAPLSAQLGVEQLEGLVARYNRDRTRAPVAFHSSGDPAPLPDDLDLILYRLVEGVLGAEVAPCAAIDVRFGRTSLCLNFALDGLAEPWPETAVRDDVVRAGGKIRKTATDAGERISVELPLGVSAVRP